MIYKYPKNCSLWFWCRIRIGDRLFPLSVVYIIGIGLQGHAYGGHLKANGNQSQGQLYSDASVDIESNPMNTYEYLNAITNFVLYRRGRRVDCRVSRTHDTE